MVNCIRCKRSLVQSPGLLLHASALAKARTTCPQLRMVPANTTRTRHQVHQTRGTVTKSSCRWSSVIPASEDYSMQAHISTLLQPSTCREMSSYQPVFRHSKQPHESNILGVADRLLLVPYLLCIKPLQTATVNVSSTSTCQPASSHGPSCVGSYPYP